MWGFNKKTTICKPGSRLSPDTRSACFCHPIYDSCVIAALVAQTVRNLPTMQETQVWSLGREDLLEKGMAIHSSILVWRIPWTEEAGGLQSMGSQRVRHDWVTNIHTYIPVDTVFSYHLKNIILFPLTFVFAVGKTVNCEIFCCG